MISAVENHSMGETLPSRHFEMTSAATDAAMKSAGAIHDRHQLARSVGFIGRHRAIDAEKHQQRAIVHRDIEPA
jgi:hypothetical protein